MIKNEEKRMKYFKKLVGEKCYLAPMTKESVPQYVEWFNDFEVIKNLVISKNRNEVNTETWIDNILKKGAPCFSIIDLKSSELIGNCALHDVDDVNGLAELGIFIGNKKFWGKGYGTEATKLILDYGFNVLNLHNIMLRLYDFNERGLGCYRKVGFKEFGKRRSPIKMAGERCDVIYMDILAEEFESPYIKEIVKRK